LITGLLLACLSLVACQPGAFGTTNSAAGQAGDTPQPELAVTEITVLLPEQIEAPSEDVEESQSGDGAEAEPLPTGAGSPGTVEQLPPGWLSLTSTASGYSLAYPPEWEICTEQQHSLILCESQAEPSEMGLPLRMYVSVFPHNYTNADWDVYNFFPAETIQTFSSLAVGQSALKYPGAILPEYVTYTRLPDQLVDGRFTLAVESSKVWEFPPETRERVVIIDSPETTYIFGMYYQAPQQLELYEQVLENVKILP